MKVLIAGATGLIGTEVAAQLRERGDEVVRLVRSASDGPDDIRWDPTLPLDPAVLDGVDAVINLAGASVGRIPWTPAYRRKLVDSRVTPTRTLVTAINAAATPPAVLINGSAVGFYGDRGDEKLDEDSAAGTGFFPDLVAAWEAEAAKVRGETRRVSIRTAVVVARGGAFTPMLLLTRLGLGSRFGRGTQTWPWISLHDEAAAIVHLLGSGLSGAINLAGPTPATSDEITRELARQLHRWYLLRVPSFAIRLLLGEAGQRLLLDSADVVPSRLTSDGFRWRDETVAAAITRMLSARA